MRADGQEPDMRHRCWTSGQMTAKSVSIKGTECKSGGCASKADKLTSGDLPFVSKSRLRVEQFILTGRQKSAEGKVARIAWETRKERKPERSPQGVNGSGE
jgi:hypothetical protein